MSSSRRLPRPQQARRQGANAVQRLAVPNHAHFLTRSAIAAVTCGLCTQRAPAARAHPAPPRTTRRPHPPPPTWPPRTAPHPPPPRTTSRPRSPPTWPPRTAVGAQLCTLPPPRTTAGRVRRRAQLSTWPPPAAAHLRPCYCQIKFRRKHTRTSQRN